MCVPIFLLTFIHYGVYGVSVFFVRILMFNSCAQQVLKSKNVMVGCDYVRVGVIWERPRLQDVNNVVIPSPKYVEGWV